nr:hypothetical protein BaRGS_017951 [Batillaria attramentaria]
MGPHFPLTWTKESDPNTAIPAKETTVVAANLRRYQSELKVNVTKELNRDKFVCSAGFGSSVSRTPLTVYVHKPPDTPVITGPASVEIGQESAWTCKVDGASSPPNVYWQFGNGTPIVAGVTSFGTNIYLDTDAGGYIGKEAVIYFHRVSKGLTMTVTADRAFQLDCVAAHFDTATQKTSAITVTAYCNATRSAMSMVPPSGKLATGGFLEVTCAPPACATATYVSVMNIRRVLHSTQAKQNMAGASGSNADPEGKVQDISGNNVLSSLVSGSAREMSIKFSVLQADCDDAAMYTCEVSFAVGTEPTRATGSKNLTIIGGFPLLVGGQQADFDTLYHTATDGQNFVHTD